MHPASQESLLRLDGVSKRFGNTLALDDVSLDFRSGRIHALIGENGAGKSTLVKIIAGVIQPDHGEVRLDGKPVAFADPADALAAGITLVHQELALLPHSSVSQNVFLGQERTGRLGLSWRRMNAETREVLATLGLDLDPTLAAGTLSTAQQQMVEIARAIRRKSRLLILDEPTAALTPEDAEKLFRVVRDLAARGTAIIYISHRLDEIVALADEISVMKDGRHVATRPAGELDAGGMIGLMVGREIQDLFPARPETASSERLLSVDNLVDPPSVRGVSFAVGVGEIVGIYGLEGHGQDEILTCLSGARLPLSGHLTLAGRPLEWKSVARMIACGIGFVPEDRKTDGLALTMTGLQNITLPILRRMRWTLFGAARREEDAAREAARKAGVKGELSARVASLSGGNQQKVLLARWLAADISVFLLNQPTRGVDVGSKSEIYSLIRKVCTERRAGALVISREIAELRGLCDRILVMCRGRLAREHAPGDSEADILASAVGHTKP